MLLPKLDLIVLLVILSAVNAFVLPASFPVGESLSTRTPAIMTQQHRQQPGSSVVAARASGEVSKATISSAKERLLDNLERRRAGEDVPTSDLDDDLSLLSSAKTTSSQQFATNAGNPATWGGRWQISYAPHIEILGKVLLTEFGSVEYNFISEDGRMVSNAAYNNKVFGSGWLNADGKVVAMEAGEGKNQDHGLVKVVD